VSAPGSVRDNLDLTGLRTRRSHALGSGMTDIITRDADRAAGLNRFYTGKPCRHGHVVERYVIGGGCRECMCIRHRSTSHNHDRSRACAAKRGGFAPPPLERDCPPRPSDGRCDSCLELVTGKGRDGFHLDHDHVTGAFRGWVCNGCNTGRGIADEADRLRTRADFLDVRLPCQ
jgi:hypothetical protein